MDSWGRVRTLGGGGLAGVALLGGATLLLHGATHPSIAWFLIVARRWAEGAALYLDIRDLNLPPTHWLFRAATELGGWLGLAAHRAYYLLVALWFLATTLCAGRLIRPLLAAPQWQLPLLAAGAGGVLVCWPLALAGERDHLALLGFLPWLALAWRRRARAVPDTAALIAAGLLAAPGLLLRPYLLAVPLAVELYLLLRRPAWRTPVRPETWSLGAAVLLLGGLALLLHPAFLDWLSRVGWLYASLDEIPPPWRVLPESLGLALLVAAGWRLRAPWREGATLLAAAAAGFLLATALQGRWQDYQLAPAEMLGLLAALLVLAGAGPGGAPRPAGTARRALGAATLLVAAVALGWAGLAGYRQVRIHYLSAADPYPQGTRDLVALLDREAAGQPVAILAYDAFDFLPAVQLSRARWTLPDETQYALGALYNRQRRGEAGPEDAAVAAWLRDDILGRLVAEPPRILGFYQGPAEQGPYREVQDIAAFYGADPRFAALLAAYEPLAELQGIVYLRRRD